MSSLQFHKVYGFFPLLTVFILYKVAEYFKLIHSWYLHSYFEDVLALPLILGFTLIIMRSLVYRTGRYELTATQIIYTLGIVILLFEFILPKKSNQYIQDYYDILAYLVGTLFFSFVMNKPIETVDSDETA